MKKRKMVEAMNLIDDAYIEEAAPGNGKRRWRAVRRYIALAACLCLMVTSAALWLFLPYDKSAPDVSRYADSEYYPLIQELNAVTYSPPAADNNFDAYFSGILDNMFSGEGSDAPTSGDMSPSAPPASYEEVTDNQVPGVIEADLLKRSDSHLFYLSGSWLRAYSIKGEDSRQVGSFSVEDKREMKYSYTSDWEMYLSADCQTVLIVAPYTATNNRAKTAVIALDVSDPAHIRESRRITIDGSYHSSRLVNGELLVFSEFWVPNNPNFSDERSFVPQIDTGSGEQSIPIDGIVYPEKLESSRYMVACKIAEKELTLLDSMAFLSYSDVLYVSAEHVYATRAYTETIEKNGLFYTQEMTEIACVSYGEEKFEQLGTVSVAGKVLNQYSMDAYNGIFRVVTTTDLFVRDPDVGSPVIERKQSADLYCIDLATWQTVAAVTGFAPDGESVQSVRFDRDSAYVCTAIIQSRPIDPVFFFDLHDLDHITYKDTGTIEGYSHALVNFADGFLLGIGVGDFWSTFKIEVYEETDTGVASLCEYVVGNADFSTDYKAYYIDRANQLIGFGVTTSDYEAGEGSRYILLHFDGYELHELVDIPLSGPNDNKRGVYIDGYLYALASNDFQVVFVG